MSDTYNVLNRADSLKVSPDVSGYSGVKIYAGQDDEGNDLIYESGDSTGTVLEIHNDWGTQQQADSILNAIKGFQYRPYSAKSAIMDPSVEIGDGITISDTYSGLYLKATTLNRLMLSDIEAPFVEELEHEFVQEQVSDRKYTRFVKSVRSSLSITATQIRAEVEERKEQGKTLQSEIQVNSDSIKTKVSKQDKNSSSTFGWNLTSDSWTIFSGSESNTILKATKDGLSVKGRIEATSGVIGGTNGFTITSKSIYNNINKFGGTQSNGVYIGTDGIQLGQGFKVTSGGALTATSGNFGSIKVENGNTTGTYHGSLSGCGGSVSGISGSLSTGINIGSKNIGTYVGDIIADTIRARFIDVSTASGMRATFSSVSAGSLYAAGNRIGRNAVSVSYLNSNTATGTCSITVNGTTYSGTCSVRLNATSYTVASWG